MTSSIPHTTAADNRHGSAPRVCHIIHEYLGHTLNWVYSQIKHTARCDHFVLTQKVQNLAEYPVEHVFYSPRLSVSRLPYVERAFLRMGLYPPEHFACFAQALRRIQPSLIHAHFGWEGYFALPLARWMKTPLVTRFYGFDIGQLPKIPMWRRRFKKLFSRGDWFLVEGEYMGQTLVALGCPAEKVIVHHLGVEVGRIPFRPRRYTGGPFQVLMAANLVEKKGLCYGLEAIARVIAETGADIRVTLIGDGPLRKDLETLARDAGIAERISWLGHQPHECFMQLLGDAHVFLSPSVTAADGNTEGGAPVALAEASAAGLPVISSFHADIPGVVLDGKTGLLAAERDVEGLSAALRTLLSSPQLLPQFGENGRRFVEREHDAVLQGARLMDIYERIADRARSAVA